MSSDKEETREERMKREKKERREQMMKEINAAEEYREGEGKSIQLTHISYKTQLEKEAEEKERIKALNKAGATIPLPTGIKVKEHVSNLESKTKNPPPIKAKPKLKGAPISKLIKAAQRDLAAQLSPIPAKHIKPDPAKRKAAIAYVTPVSVSTSKKPSAVPVPIPTKGQATLESSTALPLIPMISVDITKNSPFDMLLKHIQEHPEAQIKDKVDAENKSDNKAVELSKETTIAAKTVGPLVAAKNTRRTEEDGRTVFNVTPTQEGPIYFIRKKDGENLVIDGETVKDQLYYVRDGDGFKLDLSKSFIAPDGHPDGSLASIPAAIRKQCQEYNIGRFPAVKAKEFGKDISITGATREPGKRMTIEAITAELAKTPPPPPALPPELGEVNQKVGGYVKKGNSWKKE